MDLARIGGLYPAGVICEIMNEDGTMARVPELAKFAKRHKMPMITIADLIQYRMRTEALVRRVASAALPTAQGAFRGIAVVCGVDRGTPVAQEDDAERKGAVERQREALRALEQAKAELERILLPERNKPDLEEVPQEIRDTLEFIPVSKMEEVLQYALETNQDSGIWGGTDEEERRKLRRQWLARRRRSFTPARWAPLVGRAAHRGQTDRARPGRRRRM